MIGATLGPYRVLDRLGEGGMGEVYRARDTRLERDVAIKVLGADFAKDDDRVRRFRIEAQATGALHHPNILSVFDVGTHEGAPYLVTELLHGETLRDRMSAGRLPLSKSLDLARQVASGLAAAHAKGITHRDIKPENLFVTTDGHLKILDFGLAKASPLARNTADSGDTATRLHSGTEAGVVLGTVGYMSPEQVRGETADPRSDIFSFGIVLYELLSGERPFKGDSAVQTMNAILTEDPPEIVTTGKPLPPALERVVRHCLEKKPDERFQSARDLAFALDALASPSSATSAIAAATVPPSRRRLLPLLTAAGAGVAVVLVALAFLQPTASQMEDYRFVPFSLEARQDLPRWSPDGTAVAYTVAENPLEPPQVFVRHFDKPVAEQLTFETAPPLVVGWMAGGQRIMFRRGGALFSVASVGGAPEPVFAEAEPLGSALTVSRDGNVLAMVRRNEDGRLGVWTSSPIGQPFVRYEPDPFASDTTLIGSDLEFSADSRQILLAMPSDGELKHWLMPYPASPADPPRRVLVGMTNITGMSWMPDNRHVVVARRLGRSGRLSIVNLGSGERHVITDGSSNFVRGVVSPDGQKLIAVEDVTRSSIVQMDARTGLASRLIASDLVVEAASWAVDVPLMAYVTERNGASEIWLHEPGRADRPLVTVANAPPGDTWHFWLPALSPKGDRVIYSHVINQSVENSGTFRLWISSTSGGPPVPLTNTSDPEFPGSWSPDGDRFVYLTSGSSAGTSLMVVRTSGEATPEVLKTGVSGDQMPVWSPDGQWIKYAMPGGSDHLVSPDGTREHDLGDPLGNSWAFSRDSSRLFSFRRGEGGAVVYSLDIATGAETVIGSTSWMEYGPSAQYNPGVRLSLAPDGESFVYGNMRTQTKLWLMEGFAPRPGLLSQLGLRW